MPIPFHPLDLTDMASVRQRVKDTECRNCDLNFLNLFSWRFFYDTEIAIHNDHLLFRFKADGHRAYLAPVGESDWKDVVPALLDDAARDGHPFLMLGVCEHSLKKLEETMPGYFYANADRRYTDYIYDRQSLATLAGKKLQPKRNFANRFARLYPNHTYASLTPEDIEECLELHATWTEAKGKEDDAGRYTYEAERKSLLRVMEHWNELDACGGVLRVNRQMVAFTYGAPVNHDTFDVCMEKADTNFEGAFAFINRSFVQSLPEQFIYINREDDLGIPGLRQSKLSYHPSLLLHKYTVMTRHPMQG